MTEEEKEKIKNIYESVVKDFPFEKYEEVMKKINEIFNHPSSKKGLLKYIKEEVVDKQNV